MVTRQSKRSIADELGEILAAKGMSANRLAKEVGVSQPFISRMIRQERYKKPTGEFAGRVAEALGLPIDYWPEYRAGKVIERVLEDADYRDRLFSDLR